MTYNLMTDAEKQNDKAKNLARARQSLIEELDAISVYEERIQASKDEKLKKILAHNRDEEKEHAAMLVEYLRASDPTFDRMFDEHD
ncbi:MAG: ferritin [Patescibacteria group bacterium]